MPNGQFTELGRMRVFLHGLVAAAPDYERMNGFLGGSGMSTSAKLPGPDAFTAATISEMRNCTACHLV